jgi:hypothetical protein
MKQSIKYKINQLATKAKNSGKKEIKATLASGETSSLGKVIKSKKEGDFFMKMLKSL